MEFTVDANLVRAAMLVQGKKDPRYYFNGVRFDAENHFVAATNGHMAFMAPYELTKTCTLQLERKIPAKAQIVTFDLATRIACTETGETIGFIDLSDGNYPDIRRVFPTMDPLPTERLGFNTEYIATAGKIAKELGAHYPHIEVELHGPQSIIVVTFGDHAAKMGVMPIRI